MPKLLSLARVMALMLRSSKTVLALLCLKGLLVWVPVDELSANVHQAQSCEGVTNRVCALIPP